MCIKEVVLRLVTTTTSLVAQPLIETATLALCVYLSLNIICINIYLFTANVSPTISVLCRGYNTAI